MKITTNNLVLRSLQGSDAKSIFAYAVNPEVARYTSWEAHKTINDTHAFLAMAKEQSAGPSVGPFGITLKDNPNSVIGTIVCATTSDQTSLCSSPFCFELGYALAQSHWGKGYATEAAQALIDWVFANTKAVRIQAHCISEHATSMRVLQKIGMQHEGTFRKAIHRHGKLWNTEHYALLRDEWQNLRS